VKVVELGAFIAGPYAGQLLADLGADVVKVEPPGAGDPMRQWGFAFKDGKSLWWPVIGRNKRSLTLDLRGARGQGLTRRLIASADVLVENFRPGTLEKWGLAPDSLIAANPGLVIARVSGYGQTGPYADKGGFAVVAEAVGGMRILAGFPDREPVRTGLSIGDTLAGAYAAIGILAALHRSSVDGRGQVVDVGLTDAVLAVTESVLPEYAATGRVRVRHGLAAPGIEPSNIYPTADGKHVVIGANADGVFAKLCAAMGRPDLATDPRFAKHQARGANQAEIDGLVAD
jgi:formyl-CoA transferase/succinyl-CoA--D-citramalate CoA-transferase